MKWRVALVAVMVLCGGMGGQAWAFSGPEEKPADTSSRQVEGFYLGCRWIASPKDIPVPEKVLKRIERLRGGPMIESERDIQILISEWQRMEFRRLKKETKVKGDGILLTGEGGNGSSSGCTDGCCELCAHDWKGDLKVYVNCRDMSVSADVPGYSPFGCYCEVSAVCSGYTFTRYGDTDPQGNNTGPTCRECCEKFSQQGCEIICNGDYTNAPIECDSDVSVTCYCGIWNPSCWAPGTDCVACEMLAYQIKYGMEKHKLILPCRVVVTVIPCESPDCR
ncbi:MAG: hypothetical protein V2G48_07855 [bacterium JZ-2024 1]